MSRSWLLYLDDLIASGEKIERFVTGQTVESFTADEALFDAVLFDLRVIGEAIERHSPDARESVPELAGSGPARSRDLIAHHGLAVDLGIIWAELLRSNRAA